LRAILNDGLGAPLSWQEVVELSTQDHKARLMELRRRRCLPTSPLNQRALVHLAVRIVARALSARTLSEADYERGRQRVRRARGSRPAGLLPPADELKTLAAGPWRDVLVIAGLELTAGRPNVSVDGREPGLPISEAAAFFCTLNGFLPSRTTLEDFMAACNARLANQQRGRPWASYLDEAREALRRAGRRPPESGPRPGRPISYRLPADRVVPGAPPARENRRLPATRHRCVEGLRQFVAHQHRAGLHADRPAYSDWRRGKAWPAPSSMDQWGGFAVLLGQVLDSGQPVDGAI
jgi:hypothetical protein